MPDKFTTGQSTAKKAAAILVAKNAGFRVPTARQKQNLAIAFAKRGMVVYGRAFDIVKVSGQVNLDDLNEVEQHLRQVTIFEIKSTRKDLKPDFSGYFFALTAAEVLVAQSLKKNFKFVFVNIATGNFRELSLVQILAKVRGIYPTWSISF